MNIVVRILTHSPVMDTDLCVETHVQCVLFTWNIGMNVEYIPCSRYTRVLCFCFWGSSKSRQEGADYNFSQSSQRQFVHLEGQPTSSDAWI